MGFNEANEGVSGLIEVNIESRDEIVGIPRFFGGHVRVQIENPTKCPKCGVKIGFLNFYDEKSSIGKCPVCNTRIKMETSLSKVFFTVA